MIPSLDSEDSEFHTLLTATILISAIKEITGVSWTVMFPDGYSKGLLTWSDCDGSTDCTFHNTAEGLPRLEEFRVQGPDKVHQ